MILLKRLSAHVSGTVKTSAEVGDEGQHKKKRGTFWRESSFAGFSESHFIY